MCSLFLTKPEFITGSVLLPTLANKSDNSWVRTLLPLTGSAMRKSWLVPGKCVALWYARALRTTGRVNATRWTSSRSLKATTPDIRVSIGDNGQLVRIKMVVIPILHLFKLLLYE